MPIYEFSVPDVTCSVCVGTIERAVTEAQTQSQLPIQIRSVSVDATTEPPRATVEVDEGLSYLDAKLSLNALLETVGFEFTDLNPPDLLDPHLEPLMAEEKSSPAPSLPPKPKKRRLKNPIRNHIVKGVIGLLSGSLMLGLCISGLVLPMFAMYGLTFLGTALTFYLGKDTYSETAKKLKNKELTMHALFSISTLMALGISLASLLVPWLPMMFDTALLIFGFIHIGKAYEKSTKQKLTQDASYRALAPSLIAIQSEIEEFKEGPVKELKPGSIIRVYKGQIIPVDCRHLSKKESAIINPYSGNPLPQTIQPNELILAGSRVPDEVEFITLKVAATEEKSYLAFLEAQSKLALRKKAPLETAASKILQYFVPTVLTLATLSAIAIGVLFSPLTAIQVAATILASACPCTLGLIIPLAIKVGFIKAATQGIQFKSGETLQAAQEVDVVIFDLNGTLTTGELRVPSSKTGQPATNLSLKMLDYLAAIEQKSSHPFALALREFIYGDLKRPKELAPPVSLLAKHHSGLIAEIKGETFIVGNQAMMIEQGFSKAELKKVKIASEEAEHVIYLARGRKIEGCILLTDPLRKEAPEVIRQLQLQGKEVCFCTGADLETAKRYAAKLEKRGTLPIKHIAANCLPDAQNTHLNTKTAYIEEWRKKHRKVAMIGDGLNDSRAVESSHFSIAIESANGHKLTQQKAGAVINKTEDNKLSLRPILTAFTIANQTVKNIKQNLAISLSYNLLTAFAIGGLLVGLGFVLNPALGAALMFIQSALILVNLQRFKKQALPFANDPTIKAQGKETGQNTDSQVLRKLPHIQRQPQAKLELDDRGLIKELQEKGVAERAFKENSQPGRLTLSVSDCQLARRLVQP